MKTSKIENIIDSRIIKQPEEELYRGFLVEDEWRFEDSTESIEPWTINLASFFNGLTIEYAITMKLIILNQFKINGNIIDAKKYTATDRLDKIGYCSRALRSLNMTSLREVNEGNIHDFFECIIRKSEGGFYSNSTIKYTIQKLLTEASRPNYNYPDGPDVPVTFNMFIESIKPIIRKEMAWSEWLKGGSLGGFPVEFALLILDESLKTINDENLIRLAKTYVYGIRNIQTENDLMSQGNFCQMFLRIINKEWGIDKKGVYNIRKKNGIINKKNIPASTWKNGSKTLTTVNYLYKEYLKLGGKVGTFPGFVSIPKITKVIQNILYSCTAIIQILSGIRNSELQSLKRSSFKKEIIGDTSFTSALKKNNHNIETVRMISNTAWNAVEIAKSLHVPYANPNNVEAMDRLLKVNVPWRVSPLCGSVWGGWGSGKDCNSGLTNWMHDVLTNRISDIDLESIPNATSHRFRHTWVEIALRRFDGNVPEAIRRHLRHSKGSHMTMAYIRGKVKQDLPLLQRDYIRELVGRAGSGKEDLFGPVGNYILQRIKDVDVLSEDEIEEIVNEFDVIETYEYAYCMIPNSQRTQAKCFDKSTNLPNYNAARFELCVGCPGSLRIASHRDAIIRIGMKEQEVIASRNSQGLTLLADGSRQILKLCNYAIKEIDNKAPVNNNIDEDLSNEHV